MEKTEHNSTREGSEHEPSRPARAVGWYTVSMLEAKRNGGTQNCPAKWTNGGTVHRIAKLMKEYIDAALQFYRPISLYTMLISPVAAVFHLLYELAFYRDVRPRAPS